MTEELYLKNIHPEDERAILDITAPKNWDFKQFQQVMSALSVLSDKTPYYTPSRNRPNTIHIGPLRKSVDALTQGTKQTGHEFVRTFFVDPKLQKIIAGKKTEGSHESVELDWSKPAGKPHLLESFTIHSHPVARTSHGLSDTDYVSFLIDHRAQAMFMVWGDNVMVALKTGSTPNNMSKESASRNLKTLVRDYIGDRRRIGIHDIVNFNKAACTELGLTLYIASNKTKDLAKRVEVTT